MPTNFVARLGVVLLLLVCAFLSAPAPAEAAQWKYTAVGDSLAFGATALKGYVPRYKDYIQTDTRVMVSLNNLGQSGWTSDDLLYALRTNQTFRRSVSGSHVVTWNIGGNDFREARSDYKGGVCGGADNQDCLRTTLARFKSNWDAIVVEILALRSISNTIIRTMDIYNPYVNEDKASDSWPGDGGSDFDVFKPYVDAANKHIADSSGAKSIPYAMVYLAFNGADGSEDPGDKGYISSDGLHPNDTGHKAIADLLRALAYAPLK